MVRFTSLKSRITALSTLAFGVVLLLVAASMQWAIGVNAERKVEEELTASAKVIDRIWSMRATELESVARPLALDFGFREAVATDDDATIRSALANIASRIDLPNAFVVKYDGRVVGLSARQSGHYDERLWEDLDSGWSSGALRIDGKTFQAVAAEIKAPALIGWLVIGRRLDESETSQLSALSAIPVHASIVRRGDDGNWVHDASDQAIESQGVRDLLSRMSTISQGKPATLSESLDGKMVLVKALGGSQGVATTALMLDFSISLALAEYDSLRLAVLGAGVLGLLLVGFAANRLAAHIVHPISALERAAKLLEKGERASVPVTSEDEIGNLTASFNTMSEEILQREQRIRHMAFHDSLTDLPNRIQMGRTLEMSLASITRNGGSLAVICLDLDNFKIVNDTLGHQVGDRLLLAVARRIVDVAGDHFVARSGGDEFWVLVEGENAPEVAADLAEALLDQLKEPLTVDEQVMRPGASIGMAFAPQDSMKASDLLKHADLAMHKAKEAGRGRVVHFTAELDERAQTRREVETDLHAALANGEFELYFQPLFDLEKNRFSAFEALIRWNHPTRGLVSPVEFIAIAEETGMIVPIGEWVLKEACHQAAKWPKDIKVAVNFSTVQFNSPGLTNLIFQSLAMTGLSPDRLEVEITESLFLESSESVLETLQELKTIGCRIALDDFGTGFSSLSYLRKYPFDKIKIDRSFIIELLEKDEAGAVVKAITDLAAALNMETTAEGVEEDEQVAALRSHGCTNVQGFLFSRPVPADQVLPLLGAELSRKAA